MKSIRQRFLTGQRRFLIFGVISAMLIVVAFLLIHSNTAQTATSVETPQSEIDFLNTEVQQNGVVAVLVSIKSPEFDTLEKIPLPPGNPTLYDARIKAERLLADQARTQLLTALVGYHFKVYVGMDWTISGMGIDVDAATLNFLKTSPLVAGLSIDHVMVIPEEHMSPQPLYYTNTPVITQSGS